MQYLPQKTYKSNFYTVQISQPGTNFNYFDDAA